MVHLHIKESLNEVEYSHTWQRSQLNHQERKRYESSHNIRILSIIQRKDKTNKRKEDEVTYIMDTELNCLNQGLPKFIHD